MLGMTVAQKLRRNTNITITTRAMDSISVNSTSSTEARMVSVRSMIVVTWMEGGMLDSSCGSFRLMVSTVLMTLEPGCLKISNCTPRLPFCQPASSRFCGPLIALPMSPMRTGAPLR